MFAGQGAHGARMLNALKKWRNEVILVVLAVILALTPPVPERWGDRLRFALPTLGFGCALLNGTGIEYLGRLAVLNVGIYGPKTALADAPINLRPNGETRGFPSGHSAAAAFGASAIVNECARSNPLTASVVILAAGFTGASRVDAGKHNPWQVLAGWILGVMVERAFRKRVGTWLGRLSG